MDPESLVLATVGLDLMVEAAKGKIDFRELCCDQV